MLNTCNVNIYVYSILLNVVLIVVVAMAVSSIHSYYRLTEHLRRGLESIRDTIFVRESADMNKDIENVSRIVDTTLAPLSDPTVLKEEKPTA